MFRIPFVLIFLGVAALTGCSNTTSNVARACGEPPPTIAPDVALIYPIPGATGVATGLGSIVLAGGSAITQASLTITSSQTAVPIVALTAAPSPLPSPNALPPGYLAGGLAEATFGTLAPATTYAVNFSYVIDRSGPPSCDLHYTNPLGSFTTQ